MKVWLRLMIALFLTLAVLLSGLLLIWHWGRTNTDLLVANRQQEHQLLFGKLIELQGNPLESFCYDYTFWDDMVTFVENAEPAWARENIDISMTTFDAQAAWVLTPDFALVYSVSDPVDETLKNPPLPSGTLKQIFEKKRFAHFFVMLPNGLMEIRGATIHPTDDQERKTVPRGCFLVGRYWTKELLGELADLIGGKVRLETGREMQSPPDRASKGNRPLRLQHILSAWNGKPVARVEALVFSPLTQQFNRSTHWFLVWVSGVSGLLALIFSLMIVFWVAIPLRKISDSLDTGDASRIDSLEKSRTEFGHIARLIAESFRQKEKLLSEIVERKRMQEALVESEERYRTILDDIADGYYEVDIAGNLIFFNHSLCKLLGYSSTELTGMNFKTFMDPENARKVFQTFNLVFTTGESAKAFDWELIHKDGTKCHIDTSVSVIRDKNGKMTGFRGIARDVTERKNAEEMIRREQVFSESIINSLPGIFYLFDENGNFLRWNSNFENVSGYSSSEIAQMTLIKVFPDNEKKYIAGRIQNVFTNGRGDAEAHILSKSGKQAPYYFTGYRIQIEGRPYLIGMGIDITERKAFEEALIRSQEEYRGVVENANDVIIILQDGRVVFHNTKAIVLTGYSQEELAETPFINFVIPDDRHAVSERHVKQLNGEKFGSAYAFGIMDKNGQEIAVEVNTTIISWKGKPALQCFMRDVTLQKKLEAQLQQAHKLEAIGTLAGGIAHDFNNIVGIILGNTELAMRGIPDLSPARKNLQTVLNACDRARDVVKQILNFSSQTHQEQVPVMLGTIVRESLKLLRSSIPATIDIRAHIPDEPTAIVADPVQIHQAVINLCTNAAHAMKESGGIMEVSLMEIALDELSVRQYAGLAPGPYMRLSISDTGEGIDSKIIGRIFDPYFTTKKTGEGTGMGLAVVHGIVKNHKGAITVYSEPGRGTTFRMLFPKIEAELSFEKEIAEELPGGTEKILYVDDDLSLVEIGKEMLEYLGYRVEAKTDPVAALEMFRTDPHRFDLVITDMTMPKMPGNVLVQELIRIRPDIPIILNTGYSDQIDEVRATEAGIRAYLLKPLSAIQLARTIRKVLDEK